MSAPLSAPLSAQYARTHNPYKGCDVCEQEQALFYKQQLCVAI